MARRHLIPSYCRGVTICALKNRLLIGDAGVPFFDLGSQNVLPKVIFLGRMTLLARHNGHVRVFHRSDIAVLRDPYMT